MEKHPQGKEKEKEKEGSQSQTKKEGKCEFISRKQDGVSASVHDDIILHILKLYGSCATPSDFEIYSPNASFEDPLMCARGLKQIKSAFYSLPKVFSESRIVEYSVKENIVSPGNHEIWVDNKQHYKFMGKDIDMISLIKLSVLEGKVVRHEDWWDKKPLSNRETVKVPLLGRILEMARRGSMLATHVMMGFGKDPPNSTPTK
ncbi:hypothetical protein FF1_040022 [Malus domestica]|uniref:SnoaL-like domain-containing protein n=1 Tax=Malus domestica TaxID=3750 RepID=A0A498JBE3_MALDO|nr:uncharacterized protein LOC126629919 [Malus sylvestris]RXH93048.1 hypothetical protein DVH24_013624 [Malus domestica]